MVDRIHIFFSNLQSISSNLKAGENNQRSKLNRNLYSPPLQPVEVLQDTYSQQVPPPPVDSTPPEYGQDVLAQQLANQNDAMNVQYFSRPLQQSRCIRSEMRKTPPPPLPLL